MNRHRLGIGCLILVAMIWGSAFVAQKEGMNYFGPFQFNGIRFLLGSVALLPVIRITKAYHQQKKYFSSIIVQGFVLSIFLFLAASLQQVGIKFTTAGNAGFITSFYIIFVPFIGFFLGDRIRFINLISSFVGLAGLYFISVQNSFIISKGDFIVLISAVFWASHVLYADRKVKVSAPVLLAFWQFFFTGLLSLGVSFYVEPPLNASAFHNGMFSLIYAGLVSAGVGYTLQLVAQRWVEPSLSAIILSMESAFAMLSGILFLSEPLTWKKGLGALLMLIAVLISQLNSGQNNDSA